MKSNTDILITKDMHHRKQRQDLSDQTDLELFIQIGNGNKDAMAEFIRRYHFKMKNFISRHLGRQIESEDIVQEVFIKVWQNAPTWINKDIPPQSWVYKVAYNLCVDELRKSKPNEEMDFDRLASSEESPEEHVLHDERSTLLDHAFKLLSPDQRTAISLCNYQGFSNREAAEIMQLSIEAIESLLARGRRKLKMILINQ